MKQIYLIILLVLFVAPMVHANKTEQYIQLLSKVMEKDCTPYNISINKIVINKQTGVAEVVPSRVLPGKEFPAIIFRQILTEINQQEYIAYDFDPNTPLAEGILGYHIINCGPHYLDINGRNWYWRGQEVVLDRTTPTSTPTVTTTAADNAQTNGLLFTAGVILVAASIIFGFIMFRRPRGKSRAKNR